MVVVLSEASFRDTSTINGRELHSITETARMFGCRVFAIPPNFDECETAENALAYVPVFDPVVPGVWAGYIPAVEHYTAIYEAALAKGVRLLNTPAEYQMAMEFDRFYPLLGDMTPQSVVLHSLSDYVTKGTQLGFPVFVKGAIKSNKEQGWSACVANNLDALVAIASSLFAREGRSRGRVIVRKLAKMRCIDTDYQGFPLGREYRVFLYQHNVLAYGFYWDEYTDASQLLDSEERAMLKIASEASRRVGVPFISVDVGQIESGEWIVIEVGDGQFSGLSHVPVLELWGKIRNITFNN